MDENQVIVQTIRDGNIPLRRISTLDDVETLDDTLKKKVKEDSYLLLSYNEETRKSYKQKLSSLYNDINEKFITLINNYNSTNSDNFNNSLEQLRQELTALINTKSTVSINDVKRLINQYPHLSEADVKRIINEEDDLTLTEILPYINNAKEELRSDINSVNYTINRIQSSLSNYYTKNQVDSIYVSTNNAITDQVTALQNQLTEALRIFANKYLTIEDFNITINQITNSNVENLTRLENKINENAAANEVQLSELNNKINENHTANGEKFTELDNKLLIIENKINDVANELTINTNIEYNNSRIDLLEAKAAELQSTIDDIKENGYTPTPPMPETTVTESYSTYFWLVNESNINTLINNSSIMSAAESYAIRSVTSGCPMQKNKKYNALSLILSKFGMDDSLEKIQESLYIILPSNYLSYEGNNILISNNYLRTNTLDINVFNKSEINVTHQTVKTIKTVYNYEDRTETTTENINIQYSCLKVVDSIESGLELNY